MGEESSTESLAGPHTEFCDWEAVEAAEDNSLAEPELVQSIKDLKDGVTYYQVYDDSQQFLGYRAKDLELE